jgi:hypothetical protein
MHPMQDYFFGKVFICRVHRYATYMHFYVGKKIILVKSGCYKPNPLRRISPSRFKKCSVITQDNLL